ncbi:MAG: UDP-N-acetylglucosamine 2-epimerase (hydrolyzing) [Dorea sp.]|nr:UDP-N-acetylglucosamine 2-epimerase (hydrolyzing) [Dorea sp.]
MVKTRIAFATGSRADYGIVRRYLGLLNEDSEIELEILVTGALLDDEYGHQEDLIYEDGFKIGAEIALPIRTYTDADIVNCMAAALDGFGKHFAMYRYDLLIILGDRYEMLSVATAASMQRVPILHLHGGEATFANYDEFIRHCITKMSLYHFTATEVYRNRVIQLGEHPDRVFNLGALGAENCCYINEDNVPETVKGLKGNAYFVILFHPETLTNVDVAEQIEELLRAIQRYKHYQFVFLGSNADTHSEIIRKRVHDFVENSDNTIYYENLHTDAYHFLLKNSLCLIGNSSSGIIEAPSLGIYTINIGQRQDGRVKGNSVIDVNCRDQEIAEAIKKVVEKHNVITPENPYFQENSAEKYYITTKNIIKRLDKDLMYPKIFYDLGKLF